MNIYKHMVGSHQGLAIQTWMKYCLQVDYRIVRAVKNWKGRYNLGKRSDKIGSVYQCHDEKDIMVG